MKIKQRPEDFRVEEQSTLDPGATGGFTLYRQFGSWYRERDKVLKDSLIPGIEGFQGNIGDILLGKSGSKDQEKSVIPFQ